MPDVWTTNPEKLRRILDRNQADIQCGDKAPSILKDRDPDWTCHLAWEEQGEAWIGEIYIHDLNEIAPRFTVDLVVALAVAALTFGYLIGKRLAGRQCKVG